MKNYVARLLLTALLCLVGEVLHATYLRSFNGGAVWSASTLSGTLGLLSCVGLWVCVDEKTGRKRAGMAAVVFACYFVGNAVVMMWP